MSWNLEEAMSYYRSQGAPADQNALKNLLLEIQQEQGGAIAPWVLSRVAADYGVRESFLSAVCKRYPSLKLESGSHLLEICGGSGCSKRGHLCEWAEKTYGKSPDGFSLRVTPCMHMCGQGPIIRWDGEIYCGADEQLIRSLVEGGAAAEPPKPSEKPEKKEKKEKKGKKKDKDSDHREKKEKEKKEHRKDKNR